MPLPYPSTRGAIPREPGDYIQHKLFGLFHCFVEDVR